MNLRDRVKHILKILGHAMGLSLHERLDHVDRQLGVVVEQNNALARTQTALLQGTIHLTENPPGAATAGSVVVESEASPDELSHPEIGLIEFLYTYLPARTAVDAAGCDSEFAGHLRAAGYDVRAAEDATVPGDIAIARIEVAAELGDLSHQVVVAGFGAGMPVTFTEFLDQMRRRDYFWHIALSRI
ncbi:MAG: hypothetical protein GY953_06100, partial [bacterium]|nr:hypothetical protein [bacterium]